MTRDPWQLRVFCKADELALRIYETTKGFPVEERFGLQAQLRRAAVSVPTNIVEGSERWSARDYVHFLNIAQASASEARYLVQLCGRLALLRADVREELWTGFDEVCRGLQQLVTSIKRLERDQRGSAT
jgi:four helix bundle protein